MYMIYIFAARFVLDYVAVVCPLTQRGNNESPVPNFSQLGFRHTGLRISAAMRLAYMRSLMALPVSNVDAIPQGNAAAIITITATQVQDGIAEKLCLLIQNISLVISAIVVAFIFSWLLAVVTVAGLFFVMIVYTITVYFLTKKWNKVAEADREGAAAASEAITSIRMVAACGAEDKMARSYGKWVKEAARYGQQMSIWLALQSSMGECKSCPIVAGTS